MLVRLLGLVLILLVLANIGVAISYFYFGRQHLLGLVEAFSLNLESNLPTYFSGMMLLFAAVLLALIASAKKQEAGRFRRHWLGLSLVFLLLSVDEMTSLHEVVGVAAASIAGITGVGRLYFWVVPILPLLLMFGLWYLKFLLDLPPRYKRLFLASGALYVGGAVGFEMVSAWHALNFGYLSFVHAMIFTVEETLEMAGVLLFIYSLLHYLHEYGGSVRLEFGPEDGRQHPETKLTQGSQNDG